jgi:DNA-directed RNA polymerase specialized sigma24 family protein
MISIDGVKEQLHAAVVARREAEVRYRRMITVARAQGWTNEEIARVCGVTEAAIRMYHKRHQEREPQLTA